MTETQYEYGIREGGVDRWPDGGFKPVFFDSCPLYGTTEAELLESVDEHRYDDHDPVLIRRPVFSVEVVGPFAPLPTTPGSVVRHKGLLYVLTIASDEMPWRAVTEAGWAFSSDVVGAEVLFDAGAGK